MATDAQSLMDQGKCFACLGVSQFRIMKLALLAQIANAMSVDTNTLLDQAKCYTCLGISIADSLELALLAQVASGGGGGGGGGGGLVGVGSPQGVVTANPGTSYLDSSGDHFWFKKTGTGNTGWVELIQ